MAFQSFAAQQLTAGDAAIPEPLDRKPPRKPDGTLDPARLRTGEIADLLQRKLSWLVELGPQRGSHPELKPYLEALGEFLPDYCWAILDQRGPSARLVRVTAELLHLEKGAGWCSAQGIDLLTEAIAELRAWPWEAEIRNQARRVL